MENFTNELNRRTKNKYEYLKVLKVVYNTTFLRLTVNFIYPEKHEYLTSEEKQEITNAVSEILNIKAEVICKFNKSYLDDNLISEKLINLFQHNYSSVFSSFDKNNLICTRNEDIILIKVRLNPTIYKYFIDNQIESYAKTFMECNFCATFNFEVLSEKNLEINDDILQERMEVISSSYRPEPKAPRYDVESAEVVIGKEITPKPEFIKNMPGEKSSVILAGKISNIIEKTYVSKRNKAKNLDITSFFFTFTLTDITGKISCVYFSNKSTYPKFKNIIDGNKVLCLGNVQKGYNGDKSYSVKDISLCEIDESSIKIEEEKKDFDIKTIDGYKYVFPAPYNKFKQENLFTPEVVYPDDIINKTYVVFDVETTGLSYENDELIELGAVKIVNGKITEVFQTLIKPKRDISQEITNITNITNDMVSMSPLAENIIIDFYKFCENSILVGHNIIAFDFLFIDKLAKSIGLKFEHELMDTLIIARKKIYSANYKLITLVNTLKLELNDAHRALNDAIATADVFLALSLK